MKLIKDHSPASRGERDQVGGEPPVVGMPQVAVAQLQRVRQGDDLPRANAAGHGQGVQMLIAQQRHLRGQRSEREDLGGAVNMTYASEDGGGGGGRSRRGRSLALDAKQAVELWIALLSRVNEKAAG
ncbi:MAG: hypothetical protein E6H92_02960 [Chloroflexi bacterium]|nr:MAG: hypothetical protein E6H92_02960 [Chloroflexota bacterium]